MKQTFITLPSMPMVLVNLRVGEDGVEGYPSADEVAGARVKIKLEVPEEMIDTFDAGVVRARLVELGASMVREPEVKVLRRDVVRDVRHSIELPLEESLMVFAEETKIPDAERRVAFAAALAREADGMAR